MSNSVEGLLKSKHGHHLLVAVVKAFPSEALFVPHFLLKQQGGFHVAAEDVYGVRVVNAVLRNQSRPLTQIASEITTEREREREKQTHKKTAFAPPHVQVDFPWCTKGR